ncbi:phosphoglycolate phosphatase [Fontimonas thermophila]|uniref:phosphoglycolate phosphatase n=1 Tax=Fontimonas thermophila TaxID=1076937 RepID=A0A1I2I1F4_9GAMM|nr:phosphoglycolate phosphatase [Fontimonas thermophila]SFF34371.1 phosphoglycolate phosphatase [Fontimonas thermophila]
MIVADTMRALLFDLDGTLVDTAPDLGAAANHVRSCIGLPPLPIEAYRPVASAGARGLLARALAITPEHPEFDARRECFLTYYRAHIAEHSRPFDGIPTLLERCRVEGLRWGVVTNKPGWLTRPLLEALGLAAFAACIVSADEVSCPKPAPDSLLRACTLLDLSPRDCVYVGDDRRDIIAGVAAGMPTVAAAWGYLGENAPIETWGADLVAQSPHALQHHLFGH